jgi:hypothetical protein
MVLVFVIALVTAMAVSGAQAPAIAPALGVSGYVLTPAGTPAADGTSTLRAPGAVSSGAIGRNGRFTVVPHAAGVHDLSVHVPGFGLHRVRVAVPESRTIEVPPIHLQPAAYLHLRLLAPAGEPLASAFVLRQSFDATGSPIWEPSSGRRDEVGPDGGLAVGPLPRGATTLVVDARPFARLRLPDVRVTGESPIIDGGTVKVDPGSTLHVDVVDGSGAAVANHEVVVEDAVPFSPAPIEPQRTDASGRASFARLGAGRYHVWTRAQGMCADRILVVARAVRVSGVGTLRLRLVIGGSAALRLTSSGVPQNGTPFVLAPEPPQAGTPAWLREAPRLPLFAGRPFWTFDRETPCPGATGQDGRARLTIFPPGPARLAVRLPNSIWTARLQVPATERETPVEIPPGFMPVRVVNATTGADVTNAALTWTSRGGRVEATTSSTGDALLEGMGDAPGVLSVRAAGYRPREEALAAPSAAIHEVTLEPTRGPSLECLVTRESGEPLAHAVVELTPADPMETGQVATSDARGIARFFEVAPGSLRLAAGTREFVRTEIGVAASAGELQTIVLSRGYRIVIRVAPAGDERQRVRVTTERGEDLDALLDAASDRVVGPSGLASLGPLPPGTYVVELSGPAGARLQRVRIGNADAHVTFE